MARANQATLGRARAHGNRAILHCPRRPAQHRRRMDARRRLRHAWAFIPVCAVLFTLAAGRGWPIHLPARLPNAPATSASLFVYAPAACRMTLEAGLIPQPPSSAPLAVHVVTQQGKAPASVTAAATRASKGSPILTASAPLELWPGLNSVTLTLGSGTAVFTLQTVTVTQGMFTAGNLLFCLSLAALVGASIAASRALGASGLHGYGGASLIGFLIITATATVLSWAHALASVPWAATLTGMCLVVGLASRRRPAPYREGAASISLSGLEIAAVLALTCPMFIMQILSSINAFDDLMYHGPRTAFWRENASAMPFLSHNDRLSVFPLGGDLLFAFGTIISGSELPGKLMVFLAYPLSLFAMLATLRSLGVRSGTALGLVAIFAVTPQVFVTAVGIKPDLWLVLLGVITLDWVIVARRTGALLPCALAAAAAAASLGVKWTAAPLVMLTPLLPLLAPAVGSWKRRAGVMGAVCLLALTFGGAGPVLFSNLRASHHPFGPLAMRLMHQPEPGWRPMAVQLKRLLFILVAPPSMPVQPLRAALQSWEISAAAAIGAMEPLRDEIGRIWPGGFTPRVRDFDDRFGLAWLFVMIGAAGGAVMVLRRRAPASARFPMILLLGSSAAFTFMVVTQTRWQSAAGLPDRFLMPALAFGLLGAAWPIDRMMSRRVGATILLGLLLAWHALPFLTSSRMPFAYGKKFAWQAQTNYDTGSEFEAISRLLAPGRTILLITEQGSRDYPLFRSREGFANRVVPWGKSSYDKAAFERALKSSNADTVILANSRELKMLWDPPFLAQPFLDDLAARPDFRRTPPVGDLAVFVRRP